MRSSDLNNSMDQGFEILPGAGDTRLRVWGKTVKDVFSNALSATAFYLKPEALQASSAGRRVKRPVKIKAVDLNSLLVEFLSQALAQANIHDAVFTAAAFRALGDNFLEGEISGVKVEDFERDIRSVSYNEVDIKKNPETGLFETMLVFDV